MKYLTESLDHWQGEASRLAAENEALRVTKDEAVALVYEGNEIIKEAMTEIQRLNKEIEATANLAIKQGEWLQSIVNITKGEPGELERHSTHDVVESVEALRIERDEAWKPSGLDYDRGIHHNPDAKAWADLFVETFPNLAEHHETMIGWFANAMMAMYDHVKNKESKQEAHIKAAGAREALQRATVKPGFSKALVRINTMLEVIEKMESEA